MSKYDEEPDENIPLDDLPLADIAVMIDNIADEYRITIGIEKRRKLRQQYTELVDHYNKKAGIKAYKKSL